MNKVILIMFFIFNILVNTSQAKFKEPRPFKDFEGLGDTLQYIPTIAGYTISLFKRDLEGAKQLTRSTIVTGGLTYGLKEATNSTSWGERPNGDSNSFPSGHTSLACSGAAFLNERYGWEYGWPALAIAATVGVSRVESDKHHVRDVLAGCALAFIVNEFFVIRPEYENIIPVIGPKFIGFRLKLDYTIPNRGRR